ncbi:Hypothetical predicted protein [Mytilus galloprovincialis]|uniref:ATP synthase F(0) complex subunit e, mitochondrial n=1 Tax=Mytilus galloprovincialis TaxID=29158 RepID=A0A8B6H2X2_MYTGA|nr:Hypothetical predicted protein [Mytilus galloprovincialis]
MLATPVAARNISPLIRLARYTAVISGFVYGGWRLGRLERKEAILLEREDKIREKKAIRAAELKKQADYAAMVELAVGAGVKPKDPMYKDDPVFKDMK